MDRGASFGLFRNPRKTERCASFARFRITRKTDRGAPVALSRALHSEVLKMKRTIALKMVVVSPAVVVLLIFFMASQAPFSTVNRHGIGNEWAELTDSILKFWALLMMPLFITLETALVAGLDHSGNQWKILLVRPVPRWTLYMAKLVVVVAMTAASTLVLLGGILMDGSILPRIQPQLVFGFPVPWTAMLRDCVQIAGLAFLALTIQHWVSLRWQSFSVAIGAGIVATLVGFFAVWAGQQVGGWPQYFPWSLPMLVMARHPHNIEATLLISGAAGLIAAAAGCWDFCRREVS
ncbi:MAG: ABC transporter permease [Bryobacteraceae bacterium]